MPLVRSRRRDRVLLEEAAPVVNDLPTVAAVHRLLVRLAIRRLTERKATAHVPRIRAT